MSIGLTSQHADSQYQNFKVKSHLPAKDVRANSVLTDSLTVLSQVGLGPTTVNGNLNVQGDLNVTGQTSIGSFDPTQVNVTADEIVATANTGLTSFVVTRTVNLIQITFSGQSTGSASTLGVLAEPYRPSSAITTGYMFVVSVIGADPPTYSIETLSLAIDGTITPSTPFVNSMYYTGTICYTL